MRIAVPTEISGRQVNPKSAKMKAFIALTTLVAAASAEAKPYWGYGSAYGIPAVHHAYGKRSADAEAKPYWGMYGGAYGLPATTSGYGSPSVYHAYGKRSADAEAKPYW